MFWSQWPEMSCVSKGRRVQNTVSQ